MSREGWGKPLLRLMDQAAREDGVWIRDLSAGDTVTVVTRNTRYELRILDPERQLVRATSDGKYVTEPTELCIQGSSLTGTGTMVRTGWVAVGYRLLLGADLLLSETREVHLNGIKILPGPAGPVH